MDKRDLITEFVGGTRIAVVGVSRNKNKFGHSVFRELKAKGYDTVPVNPGIDEFEGEKCYASVNDVPGELKYVLTVIQPDKTSEMVKNISRNDIKTIWMQKGSESGEAINYCSEKGINTVTEECLLMYAQPAGFHKFHHFVAKVFGKAAV